MRIRTKTSVIIIVSVILTIVFSQISLEYFVNKDIKKTEERETRELVSRITANINNQINNLNLTDYSWSNWDDTYYFVQDHNQKYIVNNFNVSMLASCGFDMMIILDKTGNDVFDLNYNSTNQSIEEFPPGTLDMLIGDHLLQDHSNNNSVNGMMDLPSGPCLISAWSILKSNFTGPSEGTLILGKYIDSSPLSTLSQACGTSISIVGLNGSLERSQMLALESLRNNSEFYIIDSNESTAMVFSLINDIHGQPKFLLSTQISRAAFQQGSSTLFVMFAFLVLIGVDLIVVSFLLINNVVLSRVTKLENDVRKIRNGSSSNERITLNGNDELSSLSYEINDMINSIEKRNLELRESEARYRSIMEQSVVAIMIVNLENDTILRANPAFGDLFGYSEDEIHMLGLSSISTPNTSNIEDVLRSISKEHPVVGKEIALRNKKGEVLDIEISGSEIEYEGAKALSVIAYDITERHRLEQEMARAQKLESLGVLAGGIAHDFNNMLASIVSNIEIARSQADNEILRQRLDESVRSAMRAKHLTQQLLTFSKGGLPIKEVIDLAPHIRPNIEFVLAGSNVVAEYDIEGSLGKINADPIQIDQVINNLVINAVQSMAKGGRLYIKAMNLGSGKIDHPFLEPGPYIRIDIRDEGVGIPEKDMESIFDPFYTTKATGTGLGLSTVRSIIKNHGGIVLVASRLGIGTTFSVVLPSVSGGSSIRSHPKPIVEDIKHHGRILVMDDEDPILEVLQIMLEGFGYEVVCARTGEETIVAYREALSKGQKFKTVIMDLTIRGGMGGKEAIKEILAMDPKARVIVSSGYSNDPIMANPREFGFWDVLSKPFTMQDLSLKVNSAMEENGDLERSEGKDPAA
jgi:PAS domain S-box-containing protein